jgi:hypothetical protein
MNTRDGKFFPNAYYPYNQGYMEDNVKGLVSQFLRLLDLSLKEIHLQFECCSNPLARVEAISAVERAAALCI